MCSSFSAYAIVLVLPTHFIPVTVLIMDCVNTYVDILDVFLWLLIHLAHVKQHCSHGIGFLCSQSVQL